MAIVMSRPKTFDNNLTVGGDYDSTTHMIPLKYNVVNGRIAHRKIGTKEWLDGLFEATRAMNYDGAEELVGTTDEPTRPMSLTQPFQRQTPKKSRRQNEVLSTHPTFSKLPERTHTSVAKLLSFPQQEVTWLTANTLVVAISDYNEQMVLDEGTMLNRTFRRRFKNPVFCIIPEIDLKDIDKIPDGLFAVPGWKKKFKPHELVVVIHFHGMLHADGLSPAEIEAGITHTPTGRRCERYAGSNQVRCIPMHEKSAAESVANFLHTLGYALKGFFRPPVRHRPHEGFVEWLRIIDSMFRNPSLIQIGGVRRKRGSVSSKALSATAGTAHSAMPRQHLAPGNVYWCHVDRASLPDSISLPGDYVISPCTFTSCLGLGNVSAWDLILDKPFLDKGMSWVDDPYCFLDSSDPTSCFGLGILDEKKYLGTVLHLGRQYGRYWNSIQQPSGP